MQLSTVFVLAFAVGGLAAPPGKKPAEQKCPVSNIHLLSSDLEPTVNKGLHHEVLQEGKEWNPCGSACPPRCDAVGTKVCTLQCVIGCQCKKGLILNQVR